MLSQEFKDYLTDPEFYIEGKRASWFTCQEKKLTLHQEQIVLAVAPVHYDLSSKAILYPAIKVVYDGTDEDFLHQYKATIYNWKSWEYKNSLMGKYGLSEDEAFELTCKISHITYCAICCNSMSGLSRLYWELHPLHWPT